MDNLWVKGYFGIQCLKGVALRNEFERPCEALCNIQSRFSQKNAMYSVSKIWYRLSV